MNPESLRREYRGRAVVRPASKVFVSCVPVFAGSRVPVHTLLDYLEGGDSLDDFLMDFPSVSREHAIAVLEAARSALLAATVAA